MNKYTYTRTQLPAGKLSFCIDTEKGVITHAHIHTPDSSAVESVGFVPTTNPALSPDYDCLVVYYKNGRNYVYRGVPFSVAYAVMSADSIGTAVNELIKKAGYEYTEVAV